MKRPFAWYGGKHYMLKHILPLVPAHKQYIEPFFGAGAVFFAKDPASLETVNDLDSYLHNFWTVLRDRTEELIHKCAFTPCSRQLYDECRELVHETEDPVEQAWRWWVVARQSVSGVWGRSWGGDVKGTSRGMSHAASRLIGSACDLNLVARRLQRTQIECRDGVEALAMYCTSDSFCYCDPPYIQATRVDHRGYQLEMDMGGHSRLLQAILSTPGRFILSGYNHALYEQLRDHGWGKLEFELPCHAKPRTRQTGLRDKTMAEHRRTEVLWLDPRTAEEKSSLVCLTQFPCPVCDGTGDMGGLDCGECSGFGRYDGWTLRACVAEADIREEVDPWLA